MPGRRSSYRRNTPSAAPSEWWLDQSIGTFKEGDVILNRFEIQKCIGRGGMSLVYHAKDRNRKEDVALKFLSPALLLEPDAKDRFLNEARISIRLQHPGILRVFEIHEDQGIHFLSMELLRGENLRERLIRWKEENHEVNVNDVLHVIKPVAEALAYAHLHTVHRDIKPENIGIDQDGKVYLMDFGLAEALRPDNSDQQRHTLSYV
ncbi:serine/threonine protein kinase, partial [bacterium]|nr:serine/threonine protein kinase [bacterium]